jgi:hypothetical protein
MIDEEKPEFKISDCPVQGGSKQKYGNPRSWAVNYVALGVKQILLMSL